MLITSAKSALSWTAGESVGIDNILSVRQDLVNHKTAATRSPTSEVEKPILPAAELLIFSLTILITASSIALAAAVSSRKSSIIWPAQMAASGLMTPLPVYFGALPPIGSNMLVPWGLMLPPAAIPIPP